jgi:Rieske Fe-S protein
MTSRPDRRHALTLAATVGLSPAVLAACGGDDTPTDAPDELLDTGHTPDAPDPGPLTGTAEIAVGGGKIFPDQQVVVTQPTEGEFKCFTAVCTHQGCIVSSVSDGNINCECHGSAFSISDGSVVTGPATAPLGEQSITVDGDAISLG